MAPRPVDSICHDPETGILFASFKYVGYDYAGDMERMRENPKVREWWEMTDSYQQVRSTPMPYMAFLRLYPHSKPDNLPPRKDFISDLV